MKINHPHKIIRNDMKKFIIPVIVQLGILLIVVFVSTANAQTGNDWPIPTVIFYDCNSSSAVTNPSNPDSVLAAASGFIFQQVLSDSSFNYIFLLNYGTTDTLAADSSVSRAVVSPPDTSFGDFIIKSTILGSPGSYSLMVSLLDARSQAVVASGSADFSTATIPNVEAASNTATATILPLVVKIRNYQIQLRASHPGECISPSVSLHPSASKVSVNESVSVAVNVTDCDGTPLSGLNVQLSATGGQFASQNVQTNGSGNATVNFNAGSASTISFLTGEVDNVPTVMKDTVTIAGQTLLTVGDPDTSSLWRLDFSLKIRKASYSDDITSGAGGTSRNSTDSAQVYTLQGTALGNGITVGSEFSFVSDSGVVSYGKGFAHYFSYGIDLSGCNSWSMGGTTINEIPNTKYPSLYDWEQVTYFSNSGNGVLVAIAPFKGTKFSYGWNGGEVPGAGKCDPIDPVHTLMFEQITEGIFTGFQSVLSPDPHGQISQVQGGFLITYNNTDVESNNTLSSDETYSYNSTTVTNYIGRLTPYSSVTGVAQSLGTTPNSYQLSQNYPNPFNPTTIINYQIPAVSKVNLKVYDVLGRGVKTLVDAEQHSGSYSVKLDASTLPTGVYFYRLEVEAKNGERFVTTKRLVLMK
jgi:Secretion system C-terminal sorting domain